MMNTRIVSRRGGIDIHVSEAASRADELMAAFRECQGGRCSCPTQEYEKVESLRVERTETEIALSVEAKAGQKIDVGEIEKCLEHTKNRIE